jgi:signal transduction histidine kinase
MPSTSPSSDGALEIARSELSRLSVRTSGSLCEALRDLARTAARALEVSRVSLWFFLDGGRLIRCACLHEEGRCSSDGSAVLAVGDFPRYFRALEGRRVVALASGDDSGIADEMRAAYMDPLGIHAMLDAAVFRGGAMAGIVCHEHTGGPRTWTEAEGEFAAAVADTIARLYEEHERAAAEQDVVRYHAATEHLQHLSELGRLAAGLAHDLNNLLTAVGGYAELLADSRDRSERDAASLASLLDAARRGASLTRQLSQLAREERRAPRVVDPRELVVGFERVLRMAAGARVDLRFELERPVARVLIDPTDLERALLNLVTNARDALPAGGRVTVSLFETPSARPGEPARVTLQVRDDGQGMDETVREHAFEPFFTTKSGIGTGLGLAIVRQAIELAGGSAELDSHPGEGTTVRLHLPPIAAARP